MVGAGIAGLSAAVELQRLGCAVVVLEAATQVGGKVRASDVGGLSVDEGGDSCCAGCRGARTSRRPRVSTSSAPRPVGPGSGRGVR